MNDEFACQSRIERCTLWHESSCLR